MALFSEQNAEIAEIRWVFSAECRVFTATYAMLPSRNVSTRNDSEAVSPSAAITCWWRRDGGTIARTSAAVAPCK